jgi:hypothetical protein
MYYYCCRTWEADCQPAIKLQAVIPSSLFGWLVADGWCWFVLREKYCWLVAGGLCSSLISHIYIVVINFIITCFNCYATTEMQIKLCLIGTTCPFW